MTIPGYEVLEYLSQTDLYTLRRGHRLADGVPVLLKTLRRLPMIAAEVELLEREAEILSGPHVQGVPRVYELLRYQGDCCLVTETKKAEV